MLTYSRFTDDALPVLPELFDPERVGSWLVRLFPAHFERWLLDEVKFERFRYRAGVRVIVLYRLHLVHRSRPLSHYQWLSVFAYPDGRAAHLFRKLQRKSVLQPGVDLALEPRLGLLLQWFPFDRHLPQLAALHQSVPAELLALYRRLQGDGDWQVQSARLEPLRYRPSLCATLCHRVRLRDRISGVERQLRYYLKLYPDQRGEQVFHMLRTMAAQVAARRARFATLRALAYFPRWQLLVTAQAPGKSLQRAILDADIGLAQLHSIAYALQDLHRGEWSVEGHRTPREILAHTGRAAGLVAWACPSLAAPLADLLEGLERHLCGEPRRIAHLDLKPDHLFIDGERVTLIDLDSIGFACPATDLATLAVRVAHLRRGYGGGQGFRVLARTLLSTYYEAVPARWQAQLAPHYACAQLELARYAVQHQQPAWPLLANHSVSAAARALDDPNWCF